MELHQFLGKIVISVSSKNRYRLRRITSSYMDVESEQPGSSGYRSHYRWECINDDPISKGTLIFEDQSLTEPFKKAYARYCHSVDGYWEGYGYWFRKD